ncbi:transposase IS2020, hypothetical [Roseovarius sp. 217]|nr:transposase IS2020, hypothetical [Roseovarius sp. 217]
MPDRVVIDKSGANLAGLMAVNVILKFTGKGRIVTIRQVKYLNNILEQDHRFIKRITGPMLGFKAFHSATATIAGIEVAHMIRKNNSRRTAQLPFSNLQRWRHSHVRRIAFSNTCKICDGTGH